MSTTDQNRLPVLDRPSETAEINLARPQPWSVDDQRGALRLSGDGAQHRRYHGLFEDMLN